MGSMLPMGSPCEAGAPRVQDLEEGAVDGDCEGALEKGAAPGPCHQDRIANSFKTVAKWPPRNPMWLRAIGTKRRLEEDLMGHVDRASAPNLTDSTLRMA